MKRGLDIVRIRPCHEADILRLDVAAFREKAWPKDKFRELTNASDTVGWIASVDERYVGFLFRRAVQSHLEVIVIAVDPATRRSGVGTCMLNFVRAELSDEFDSIQLEVRVSNASAQSFYEKYGFQVLSRCRPDWANGEDAFRMEYRMPKDSKFHNGPVNAFSVSDVCARLGSST